MINTRKDLKEFIFHERKGYGLDIYSNIYIYILSKLGAEHAITFLIQKCLRKYEYYLNSNKTIRKLLFWIKLKRYSSKYQIILPPNVFDKGLFIDHLEPIVVNTHAKVGKNCIIESFVAIASNGIDNGAPTIGDNVVIGVGAKVIGNITIGNNVIIGANSVVNKSFDSNVTIAGVPAKIISNHTSKDITSLAGVKMNSKK